MKSNNGIIGNVNAGVLAINGNATNNGSINMNVSQLRDSVEELRRRVDALPIAAPVRESVADHLDDLRETAAAPEPEPKKIEKALDRTIKVLQRAGMAASSLVTLTGPVKTIAEMIGTSLAAFGL
jgi:hypothetical protein